jgi:hypothetical protein
MILNFHHGLEAALGEIRSGPVPVIQLQKLHPERKRPPTEAA